LKSEEARFTPLALVGYLTIRKAKLVMKGGSIYFPNEIYTVLGIKPFAEQPNVPAK
jgi:hypothetical protein